MTEYDKRGHKIYGHLRVEDLDLPQKIKVRAAKEDKTTIEIVEKAMNNYLKTRLDK